MKIETPQILWHSSDIDKGKNAPLYSVSALEVAPSNHVLATAGNTSEIHLWRVGFKHPQDQKRILQNTSSHAVSHLVSLNRHDRSVNVVKFSPDGLHLATAGDGGSVIVWSVSDKKGWGVLQKETDLQCKILMGGSEGICDLSWSADSRRFVVGSIDHCVMVYELTNSGNFNLAYRNARDHTHYVQGVAYDPLGVYVSSMGSDRTVKVYQRKMKKNKKKKQPQSQENRPAFTDKLELTKAKTLKYRHIIQEASQKTKQHLFADESTVESFFRRLSWTPDGAFLVTPAALWHGPTLGEEPTFATYLFARHAFDKPYKVLPGLEKPSVAIRPNPVLFELPENEKENKSDLKYRSVFCVLTLDTVLVYDTHHSLPLCIARGLHYAGLTDAAWSADGHHLFVSSTDGYISILSFEPGELGTVYEKPQQVVTQVPNNPKTLAPLPPVQAPTVLVPPCEPGQTASIVAPPAKRAKTRITPTTLKRQEATEAVGAAVTNLSINEEPPKKKKKRISPVLLN